MWINDRIHYDSGSESLKKLSDSPDGETEPFPRDEDHEHESPQRPLRPWELFFRKLLKIGGKNGR